MSKPAACLLVLAFNVQKGTNYSNLFLEASATATRRNLENNGQTERKQSSFRKTGKNEDMCLDNSKYIFQSRRRYIIPTSTAHARNSI